MPIEKFEGMFQLDSFFVGGNVRKVTQSGYADYIPDLPERDAAVSTAAARFPATWR